MAAQLADNRDRHARRSRGRAAGRYSRRHVDSLRRGLPETARPRGLGSAVRRRLDGSATNPARCCPRIRCPVLMLQGNVEPGWHGQLTTWPSEAARLIPDCTRVHWPGAGHLIHNLLPRPGDCADTSTFLESDFASSRHKFNRTSGRMHQGLPMKTATGTTIIENGQLVDGTGAAPLADGCLVIRDGRIAYAGPAGASARAAARRRADRCPRRHDHAGAGRGALSSDLFRRGQPGRPGHQVSGRIRDAAGGHECAAGAGVRLYRGPQRRQLVQHRLLVEEGDRRGSGAGSAAGGQRSRDLRRRRADGLEPRLSQDRHGRAGAADQRARRRTPAPCASWSKMAWNG